jgi:hypothetical protein
MRASPLRYDKQDCGDGAEGGHGDDHTAGPLEVCPTARNRDWEQQNGNCAECNTNKIDRFKLVFGVTVTLLPGRVKVPWL